MSTPPKKKRLVFRLSSLGDVILASAILQDGVTTDWVCAEEYVSLLKGHSAIGRVVGFRRGAGLRAWLRLCRELAGPENEYAEVVDLHGSLRTRIARFVWTIQRRRTPWRTISKERARRWAYALFKGAWPSALRPTAYLSRVENLRCLPRAASSSTSGAGGTSLSHLLKEIPASSPSVLSQLGWLDGSFYALMPSSRWSSKEWPTAAFVEAIARLSADHPESARFVILGRPSDHASVALYEECSRRGFAAANGSVRSAIGEWSYPQLAALLHQARGYIGMDTGLAHLAEAVGTDVFTVFGPTTPEYGFGPWRAGSRAVGQALWCRPCSKDGRACFRVNRRFACIKEYSAAEAAPALLAWAGAKAKARSP